MLKTNRLFLAKLLGGSLFGNRYEVDDKYRLFYLTKKRFDGTLGREDVFEDVETKKYYPLGSPYHSRFFIDTNAIISLRDFFPTVNFPNELTRKQLLAIDELLNEMQCETYNKEQTEKESIKLSTSDEIKTRVLKPKNNK